MLHSQPPRKPELKKSAGYENEKELTRQEDGHSLTEAFPEDSRADEKVIVNEQKEDRIVNTPPDQPL